MTQHQFEIALMKLWTSSLVPMTRANILAYTKVERVKLDGWLDAMVSDSLLELDSDDDGELVWRVRGSKRPERGLTSVGQLEKLREIEGDVGSGIAVKSLRSGGSAGTGLAVADSQKSVVLSGVLSLFFGPLGWLYAAPMAEAIPAAFAYMLVCAILPHFLLVYILGLLGPLSAIAGVLYAWSHNRVGHRAPLFMKSSESEKKLLGRKR